VGLAERRGERVGRLGAQRAADARKQLGSLATSLEDVRLVGAHGLRIELDQHVEARDELLERGPGGVQPAPDSRVGQRAFLDAPTQVFAEAPHLGLGRLLRADEILPDEAFQPLAVALDALKVEFQGVLSLEPALETIRGLVAPGEPEQHAGDGEVEAEQQEYPAADGDSPQPGLGDTGSRRRASRRPPRRGSGPGDQR